MPQCFWCVYHTLTNTNTDTRSSALAHLNDLIFPVSLIADSWSPCIRVRVDLDQILGKNSLL